MVMRLCCAPGCDDLALAGLPRCADHQAERDAKVAAARAKAKAGVEAHGGAALYRSAKWRALSKQFLGRHPTCAECARDGLSVAAVEVDHIAPHRGDLKLFWRWSNWQPLCKSCHSRKTAREVWGRQDRGVSRNPPPTP